MKNAHMVLMALGCLAPVAAIAALPLLGYDVPALLYLALPLLCPVSMLLMHKSMGDECMDKERRSHEK